MPAGAPDPNDVPKLSLKWRPNSVLRPPPIVPGYTTADLSDGLALAKLPLTSEQVRAAGQKMVLRPTAPTQRMRIINPDQIYLNGSLIDNGPAFPPTTPLVWY
jgi:hypothetical protein